MSTIILILIAGLWAAFLLPSFFDHRNRAPRTSTRDFARTRQVLEQVSLADPDGEAYVRRHAQVRRQRILMGLGATAVLMLVVATWRASTPLLWITIAIDVTLASYVTLLLYVKQQQAVPRATVVSIETVQPVAVADTAPDPVFEQTSSVRVIAG